jgi:hypothetical protein
VDTLDWHVLKKKLAKKYGETISDEHLYADIMVYGSMATSLDGLKDPHFERAVLSLLKQTRKLDALFIVIPAESRRIGKAAALPDWLRRLETMQRSADEFSSAVIVLRPDTDYGPANKLVHSITRAEIGALDAIITFGEDREHEINLVELLMKSAHQHPEKGTCRMLQHVAYSVLGCST